MVRLCCLVRPRRPRPGVPSNQANRSRPLRRWSRRSPMPRRNPSPRPRHPQPTTTVRPCCLAHPRRPRPGARSKQPNHHQHPPRWPRQRRLSRLLLRRLPPLSLPRSHRKKPGSLAGWRRVPGQQSPRACRRQKARRLPPSQVLSRSRSEVGGTSSAMGSGTLSRCSARGSAAARLVLRWVVLSAARWVPVSRLRQSPRRRTWPRPTQRRSRTV